MYYLCSENKGADQADSSVVNAQIICALVFTYAKSSFSHDAAHEPGHEKRGLLNSDLGQVAQGKHFLE